MEHFQAFFNKEAADYMNATEIEDNADVGSVRGAMKIALCDFSLCAHRVGSDMCYWVLTKTCKVFAHTMAQWYSV